MGQELLYGINTVLSLLRTNAGKRKVYEIIINSGRRNAPRFQEIILLATKKQIPLSYIEPGHISGLLKSGTDTGAVAEEVSAGDQGIIARVSEYNYADLDLDLDIVFDNKSILVILDGITDVGNLGSIIRNCSAFGADGVLLPKKRSVEINTRVSKISSGALEEVKIYHITNIVSTIDKLKKSHFWIYGTTLNKGNGIYEADGVEYMFPLAVIFGSEDSGMHRLVEKSCDFLIRIEMSGRMQSLNVGTASGIFLYILRRYQKNFMKNHWTSPRLEI